MPAENQNMSLFEKTFICLEAADEEPVEEAAEDAAPAEDAE